MEKKIEEPKLENFFSNILFVSDLPKETSIKDLENLFGKYHFIKASLNNSKKNNIYAEIVLENEEYATKARHELNGVVLISEKYKNDKSKGKPIRICKYETKFNIINNYYKNEKDDLKKNLLIKNLDTKMSQKELYDIFLKYGDIKSGKIEYDENGISKGFGYIYYYNKSSAEKAISDLKGKEFYGKKMQILYFIPSKLKKVSKDLTLFISNLPPNILEKEIRTIFEKYGTIININLTNKGFAYITYEHHESISKCFYGLKQNPISFPGLPEVVVKYATSKEEREYKNLKNNLKIDDDSCKVSFQLIRDEKREINNENDLEKSIRLFIKIILIMEYVPKSIEINYINKGGTIIFNNLKERNFFLSKYREYCFKNYPMFNCFPFKKEKLLFMQNLNNYMNIRNIRQFQINTIQNRINNISTNKYNSNENINKLKEINLNKDIININDNNEKVNKNYLKNIPLNNLNNITNLNNNIIYNQNFSRNNNINENQFIYNNNPYIQNNNFSNIHPNDNYPQNFNNLLIQNSNPFNESGQNLQGNNAQTILTNLCDTIYNIVSKKYPNEAGKITGMIKDLGPNQMISLLSNIEHLNTVIEKAYNMIINKKTNNG